MHVFDGPQYAFSLHVILKLLCLLYLHWGHEAVAQGGEEQFMFAYAPVDGFWPPAIVVFVTTLVVAEPQLV
jgi:hypothetical protein